MIRFPICRAAVLAAMVALSSACSSTEPLPLPQPSIWAGALGASATPDGIEVFNDTDSPDPYYLFAIERGTATYTDWIPCTGGPGCPSVMPGERRTLPWSSIPGYSDSRHEYLVYSWRVARGGDGSVVVTNMQNRLVTR